MQTVELHNQQVDVAINLAIENGWIKEEHDEEWGKGYIINQLFSCPFCGGTPRLCDTKEYAWVACQQCEGRSKPVERRHGADEDYRIIAVIAWNMDHGGKRTPCVAVIDDGKMRGLADAEYWKLIDKRLKREGVRL